MFHHNLSLSASSLIPPPSFLLFEVCLPAEVMNSGLLFCVVDSFSLMAASCFCPAAPGKGWGSLSNSGVKFQEAHPAIDPNPYSPKTIIIIKTAFSYLIRLIPLSF
jgi:hypothetical protein